MYMTDNPEIIFPNLNIRFEELKEVAFNMPFLDIPVYWYAIFITTGMIGGLLIAMYMAKKTKQNPDIYVDFFIWAIVSAIVGARLYYVLSSWDAYKDNPVEIFMIRDGGLGFYGGVIAAVIALVVFTKVKKVNFWVLADTASVGIFVGQIFGRLGNFMNKEAFGGFTDNLFAMAIRTDAAKYIPAELRDTLVMIDGAEYLQVQPTFMYEIVWNILMLTIVLFYFKKRRFNGEIFALYFLLYGIGRAWIEPMRTDQLMIGDTGIPLSVFVSLLFIVISLAFIIFNRLRAKKLDLPYPNDLINKTPKEA